MQWAGQGASAGGDLVGQVEVVCIDCPAGTHPLGVVHGLIRPHQRAEVQPVFREDLDVLNTAPATASSGPGWLERVHASSVPVLTGRFGLAINLSRLSTMPDRSSSNNHETPLTIARPHEQGETRGGTVPDVRGRPVRRCLWIVAALFLWRP